MPLTITPDIDPQEAARRRQLLADVRHLAGQGEGQRVFWWLLERCHFLGSISTNNASIHAMSGARDVGLSLLDLLGEACPALLAELLTLGLRQRQAEQNQEEGTHG